MSRRIEMLKHHIAPSEPNSELGETMKFLMQKIQLKQDVFLLSPPGPMKLLIVDNLSRLLDRKIEYIALSQDTSDVDLTLSRKISNSSLIFVEQPVVRAVLNGSILVLDGVEKAERNVLPLLNNLLENRELVLPDGRVILQSGDQVSTVLKPHPDFLVVAFGLPVPKYRGYPLDPPFRSRFQCRAIPHLSSKQLYAFLSSSCASTTSDLIEHFVEFVQLINELSSHDDSIDEFPANYPLMSRSITLFQSNLHSIVSSLYPQIIFKEKEKHIFKSFANESLQSFISSIRRVADIDGSYVMTHCISNVFEHFSRLASITPTCLIGPQGIGKSAMINLYAKSLKKELIMMHLHREITAKDFWQLRMTDSKGDTYWRNTAFLDAVTNGGILVLDGLDSVNPSTRSTLQRFIYLGVQELPDGRFIVSAEQKKRFLKLGYSSDQLILINDAFQLVATWRLDSLSDFDPQIRSIFAYSYFDFSFQHDALAILKKYSDNSYVVERLVQLKILIENDSDRQIQALSKLLSLRIDSKSINEYLESVFLLKYLPVLTRKTIQGLIDNVWGENHIKSEAVELIIKQDKNIIHIGSISEHKWKTLPEEEHLIPNITFFENQAQLKIIERLFRDYRVAGEHSMLVGNQGVGKNKIADKFLQLLNAPRMYIQLHRDISISSLTQTMVVNDRKVEFIDSPLVIAAKRGYYLVVDEADKAPTYVLATLKSIIQDGILSLPDGTRLTAEPRNDHNEIKIHPRFRVIVLANRPGFPFLGNDFYKEFGDCFAAHLVDVPDEHSEFELLLKYSQGVVDVEIIRKLQAVFQALRKQVDEGQLSYPYSTRELINIIKHLARFPNNGILEALRNVFDFDKFDPDTLTSIEDAMKQVGLEFVDNNVSMAFGTEKQLKAIRDEDFSWELSPRKRFPSITRDKLGLMASLKDKLIRRRVVVKKIDHLQKGKRLSELVSHLIMEMAGEILDVCLMNDGQVALFSVSPANIYIFPADFSAATEIEIFDYSAVMNRKSSRYLTYLEGKVIQQGLLLFHPSTGKLTAFDLSRKVLSNYKLRSFTSNSIYSMLTFPQRSSAAFLSSKGVVEIMDFDTGESIVFDFQMDIVHITFCTDVAWIANTSDGRIFSIFAYVPGEYIVREIFSSFNIERPLFLNSNTLISCLNQRKKFFVSKTPVEALFFDSLLFRAFSFDEIFSEAIHHVLWVTDGFVLASNFDQHLIFVFDITKQTVKQIKCSWQTSRPQSIAKIISLNDKLGSFAAFSTEGEILIYHLGNIDERKQMFLKLNGSKSIHDEDQGDSDSLMAAIGVGTGPGKGGSGEGDGKPGEFHGPREEQRLTKDQLIMREKAPEIDKNIAEKAKTLRERFLQAKLKEIEISQSDHQLFERYKSKVRQNVGEIRSLLASLQAKKKERTWLKNQSFGELDEKKLVDGITGQQNVYKRRSEKIPEVGGVHEKPKRIDFLFDVSASMIRYNPHDGRLDRSLEVALMIMESFRNFPQKFEYKICGHSGDSSFIPFIESSQKALGEKEMFDVLQKMRAHAAHCSTGDNSLLALSEGIKDVVKQEGDEYFVVLLSDANISQYGIKASDLLDAIHSDKRVSAFVIFLGNLGDQVESTRKGGEFLCRIRYKNPLPDLPFPAKLLSHPIDESKLADYTLGDWEKRVLYPIVTDDTLGMPLDLIDMSRYELPENEPIIDDEDEILLQPFSAESEGESEQTSTRYRPSVPWLRRTEYSANVWNIPNANNLVNNNGR